MPAFLHKHGACLPTQVCSCCFTVPWFEWIVWLSFVMANDMRDVLACMRQTRSVRGHEGCCTFDIGGIISYWHFSCFACSPAYTGKVKSNFVGTEFTIFDSGVNPSDSKSSPGDEVWSLPACVCFCLLVICYYAVSDACDHQAVCAACDHQAVSAACDHQAVSAACDHQAVSAACDHYWTAHTKCE
jgi:hypothetical protein